MGDAENRATVENVIRAINERDLELMDRQFHEDSVMEYPQPGERIVGGRTGVRCTARSWPCPRSRRGGSW